MKTVPMLALLALLLAGCVAPRDAGRVAAFRASAGAALDPDRTRAARVVLGIDAARRGVSLGCTMLADAPALPRLDALRAYCAAREAVFEGG
jgi:hypothetical protein